MTDEPTKPHPDYHISSIAQAFRRVNGAIANLREEADTPEKAEVLETFQVSIAGIENGEFHSVRSAFE